MPSKLTVRNFEENSVYHIYNRGLHKKELFLNSDDFQTFLYYLTAYTKDPEEALKEYPSLPTRVYSKSLFKEIQVLSYCLMPNHFHLLIRTKNKTAIPKLMKQLTNAYTTYFKSKYKSDGPVVQGKYKSVKVSEEQLANIIRYILLNPIVSFLSDHPKNYRWSSYKELLSRAPTSGNPLFPLFQGTKDLEKFLMDEKDYENSISDLKQIILE